MNSNLKSAIQGAAITAFSLFGGILAGIVIGNIVFESLPGHSITSINPVHVLVAAIPAISGVLAGGALWGILIGRMAGAPDLRRMAWAGVLGFTPITIGMAILLQVLEPIAISKLAAQFPVHRLFTIVFVPTAFIIAGVSVWALGRGQGNNSLALRLLWQVGLAAAVAFLVVNLVMESAGWVVGGPRAAERFTMLTVMFAGNLGAALAGGAVLGVLVARQGT